MRRALFASWVIALAGVFVTRPAPAADQSIVGKQFLVKDRVPGVDPSKRRLVAEGKKFGSASTIVGDPTLNGAVATFSTTGATSTTQTFVLAPGIDPGSGLPFWRATSSGFVYKDRSGTNGAVSDAKIQKSGSGTFQIKVAALGTRGPITVVPPNPGTEGEMLFEIPGGDRYHVLLVRGSVVKANDVKTFSLKNGPGYRFVTSWVAPGVPQGIAVDGNGNVYVNCSGRIEKYDGNGTFLAEIGSDATSSLGGIAVDGSGNLYVNVDAPTNRVRKFDASGAFVTEWPVFGGTGIAVDGTGNVYVSPGPRKYDASGTLIPEWDVSLWSPGVAVDGSGNVYIVNTNGVYEFDGSGTLLAQWGGIEDGRFLSPVSIAVDAGGNVYVMEFSNITHPPISRVEKFGPTGTFITQWGSVVGSAAEGQFGSPGSVAVDASGNVYVADHAGHRVQKFEPCEFCGG